MKSTKSIDFTVIIIGIVAILLLGLSSCRSGYGCRGTKSWNGCVWKANKLY